MLTPDLPLHLLALLVYPGLALVLAVGAAAEVAAALVLAGSGLRAALLAPAVRLRQAVRHPGDLAAPLLTALAATQLAAPLSPISPVERSLLVAAVALAVLAWLAWAPAWTPSVARAALLAQLCWLVALLAPALHSESLRPQALGSVVVPSALPLKLAAAVLALLCLPALLPLGRLSPGAGATVHGRTAGVRLLLWLPLCGLFVSLFFPPASDDPGGVLRFLAATLATAAAVIALAAGAARRPEAARLYTLLLPALAAAVLVLAAVTSMSTTG